MLNRSVLTLLKWWTINIKYFANFKYHEFLYYCKQISNNLLLFRFVTQVFTRTLFLVINTFLWKGTIEYKFIKQYIRLLLLKLLLLHYYSLNKYVIINPMPIFLFTYLFLCKYFYSAFISISEWKNTFRLVFLSRHIYFLLV